jgi:hypothetical protein
VGGAFWVEKEYPGRGDLGGVVYQYHDERIFSLLHWDYPNHQFAD